MTIYQTFEFRIKNKRLIIILFVLHFIKAQKKTRIHSSRIRTARSSSHGGSASVHAGIHPPLGVGLETPPGECLETPPRVWACRPPQARPLNFPLGCGPGDPLARPLNFPLGVGLENLQGMLGYHPPWRPTAGHAGIPPAMHAGIPPPPL